MVDESGGLCPARRALPRDIDPYLLALVAYMLALEWYLAYYMSARTTSNARNAGDTNRERESARARERESEKDRKRKTLAMVRPSSLRPHTIVCGLKPLVYAALSY